MSEREEARVDRGDPHSAEQDAGEEAARPARKYVLFADGTGNAFTTQESNVWRLYEALDRSKPDQAAYYIKGVGTSGFRPFAMLDGATGIGVPSNVRKLYRFLCWNWQPGDEIHIFGFSRGAFTARTLAGLIGSQGLVPAEIEGEPVTHGEMQRNAKAAWRAYRRETVPWHKSLPTIWIARWIRDFVLGLFHLVLGHGKKMRAAMEGRRAAEITFLGLFDTVEAFGVPVEELRLAIDWAIWPISFRSGIVSDQVKCVRHALALDEERTTFHPIRFDQSNEQDNARIKEVWFAGVHSDVGGGYPDASLSYVPLAWMARQTKGLRFQPGSIERFVANQSAIGPMHDSRSGASVLYRYGPRVIGETKADGGAPVAHLAVVERMLHGCDNYAPIPLPASAKVWLPSLTGDGTELPLTDDNARAAMKSAYQTVAATREAMKAVQTPSLPDRAGAPPVAQTPAQSAAAADAFVRMAPPDDKMAALVQDTVWWRRAAYFGLLGAVALFAAWPWIAKSVIQLSSQPADEVDVAGMSVLSLVRAFDYGVGAVVESTADMLQSFLPSYTAPWLDIAVYYPFATTLVAVLVLVVWRLNGFLRDRIQERARLAWNRPHRLVPDIGRPSRLLKIGRFMRLHAGPARMLFTNVLIPGIFLIAIFGAALLVATRSYFNWSAGTGGVCASGGSVTLVDERPSTAATPFETKALCWASGFAVEKGRKYRIWITMQDPWFDRTIMTGVNGFKLSQMIPFLPVRRWYRADWFQPVARIGANGDAELVLKDLNGLAADELPRSRAPIEGQNKKKKKERARTYPVRLDQTPEFADAASELRRKWGDFGTFDPIPQAARPAAADIWRKQGLANLMVADLTAEESGELFLYVNDAIQLIPFLGPFDLYYKNNSGSAQVTLQRLPLPPKGE